MSAWWERLICVIGAGLLQSGCSVYDEAMLENTELRRPSRKNAENMLGSAGLMASAMHMRDAGERAPDAATAPTKPVEAMQQGTPSMPTANKDGTPASSTDEREQDDAGHEPEDASSPSSDAGAVPADAPARPVAEASMACRGRIGYLSSVDGHCYFSLTGPINWHMARDECANSMAHLATLTSDREQAFVASFGLETEAWIGLARFGAINYSWVTNEIFSYAHWQQDGPSQLQESAVVIAPFTGLWSGRSPQERHSALCETEP